MSWSSPGTAVTRTIITASFIKTGLYDDTLYLYTNIWQKINSVTNSNTHNYPSIPTTFNHLKIIGLIQSTSNFGQCDLQFRLNNDSGTIYTVASFGFVPGTNTSSQGNDSGTDTFARVLGGAGINAPTANNYSFFEFILPNYLSTVNKIIYMKTSVRLGSSSANDVKVYLAGCQYKPVTNIAINRIEMSVSAGNLTSTSLSTLYGGL